MYERIDLKLGIWYLVSGPVARMHKLRPMVMRYFSAIAANPLPPNSYPSPVLRGIISTNQSGITIELDVKKILCNT